MLERTVCTEGGATRIEWRGNEICGKGFSVTATFTPDGAGGWTYAFSYNGNESDLAVEEIRFPEITVPRTDRTAALYPKQSGMLRRPNWSKFAPGETIVRAGPNTMGFKFAATLDDEVGGWYVDQRGDARLRASQFAILNAGDGKAVISARYYPPAASSLSKCGNIPFGGVVRPLHGGWYAAAKIYRDWVRTQDWHAKAKSRKFGKLRDIALWMWNRGRSCDVVPSVERFMDETGLPCALDWYWWHEIPYDVEYPKFWPPREGETSFRATVARLKSKGAYVQTYTNGMLWDRDATDWKDGGTQGARLFRNGSEDITVFNTYLKHRMAIMCGEAPKFHACIRDVERKLVGCGLDGLYLDMIGNGASGVCWNRAHRHVPGGGTVMTDGYRALLADVRADNPGIDLSTEEEGEAYIDVVDSLIVLYACHERLGKGVEPEIQMPPVFSMLYHGCVAMYGSYAVIDGVTPWDEKWGVRPAIDEAKWAGKFPDQFACEFSRGVIWGLQPMVHKLLTEHQTDPKWADEWKFVKDTAAFYHAQRAFLFDGEMCDPGMMRCPRKPVDFFVRGCYTKEDKFRSVREPGLPVVFHSVWKAPDGRIAAVLVNWTREPAAYDLSTPDVSASGTLPPRTWRLVHATPCCLMPAPPTGANDLSAAVLPGWADCTATSSAARKSVHPVPSETLPAVWRGSGWLEFPVDFKESDKNGVSKWDVNFKADLTSRAGVEFDFWCGDISRFSQLRFYLRSGHTWFAAWPFAPEKEREWCRIRFAKTDFRPEGPNKDAKVGCIDGIRISGYRASDGKTMLGFANLSGTDAIAKKLTREEIAKRDAETLAWLKTQPSKSPEHRAFCCHSAFGMGGDKNGGWEAAAKAVKEAGFNALYANLAWPGGAYGASTVYPQSPEMAGHDDQIEACRAACRRYGLEFHIWKVFWKTGGERHADAAFLAEKRNKGLMQISQSGEEKPGWLCPTAPENRTAEIEATMELAAKGVDGILYDYIRYCGSDSCFCNGCRKRFEKCIGRAVVRWPQDVVEDGTLAAAWTDFRAEAISDVVKAISDRLRKDFPHVKILAAVFPNPKSDRQTIGQDWVRWCREGWIDRACPMDYTASPLLVGSMVAAQRDAAGGADKLCPILGPSLWPAGMDRARGMAEQIATVRATGLDAFSAFNLNIWTAKALAPLKEGPLKD